jgi:hypothetical protein
MRKHYIALVRKDSDSDYGVSFPDFPGAIGACAVPARTNLAAHLKG